MTPQEEAADLLMRLERGVSCIHDPTPYQEDCHGLPHDLLEGCGRKMLINNIAVRMERREADLRTQLTIAKEKKTTTKIFLYYSLETETYKIFNEDKGLMFTEEYKGFTYRWLKTQEHDFSVEPCMNVDVTIFSDPRLEYFNTLEPEERKKYIPEE